MKFDPAIAAKRIEQFWGLNAEFGHEHHAIHTYLSEVVSDRYVLVKGLQLIHDELQLAGLAGEKDHDVVACGADLSLPSVVTTLAHTNCGDRIQMGEATTSYEQIVASRFACKSEIGEAKLEAFMPMGGGTDDGRTLAHVTVAHQLDEPIREALYRGNASSFVLVNTDLKTHVGRLDPQEGELVLGQTQESKWRKPRTACGAVVGTLRSFDADNAVHRRIRDDLGERNFELLSTVGVQGEGGIDLTAAVAAGIVATQGMLNTAEALQSELDERGMAHLTASITVNRPHYSDTILYLSRATVFGGETRAQGFGTDATKYSGRVVDYHGDRRLLLTYDGVAPRAHAIRSCRYELR